MPNFIINPFTGRFDAVRNALDTTSRVYLGETTYLEFDGINTVNLYVLGTLLDSWVAQNSQTTGESLGLLLAITYTP